MRKIFLLFTAMMLSTTLGYSQPGSTNNTVLTPEQVIKLLEKKAACDRNAADLLICYQDKKQDSVLIQAQQKTIVSQSNTLKMDSIVKSIQNEKVSAMQSYIVDLNTDKKNLEKDVSRLSGTSKLLGGGLAVMIIFTVIKFLL